MTAPAFEEVPMPPLPEPARRQGQQMSFDGHDKAFFDCYDNAQMLAYGKECRNAALEEAAKRVEEMDRGTFRKRAGGMVEIGQGARDAVSDAIRALKKENGDA